jgi:hypothetical protein
LGELNRSIVRPAADATRDVHASPNNGSEDLAANASLNSAKPVSGLADVLAIAGEEPDAARQGVRVAGRRHRRDTTSGKGRAMVRMCAATPRQRHHKNAG